MKKTNKNEYYAQMITSKIIELLDEDIENDLKITFEELQDEENFVSFIHALSNMMPAVIFNKLSGKTLNNLEFNHLANRLVFQNSTLNKG